MTHSGRVAFLPWVSLPKPVAVGGFRFVPVKVDEVVKIVGEGIAEAATKAIQTPIDQSGAPIERCALILRPRAKPSWHIPDRSWPHARSAAGLLAFLCLSEQRFFRGHFAPHLNSTMFQAVSMGVNSGSENIGLFYKRRGGGLGIGGRTYSDTVFQQPEQIEGTSCGEIDTKLLKALLDARKARHEVWDRFELSLEFFLLANAEMSSLSDESCLMLSAIAFDRLLQPNKSTALGLAGKFAHVWASFQAKSVGSARRVKVDLKPEWKAEQQTWPVRRKWAKELYEARSAQAHRGPRSDFLRNWEPWQHMVIAAFAYPLTVKIMIQSAGFFSMSEWDRVCCDKLDDLLDSDFGNGWIRSPDWSSILDCEMASRKLR